MSNVRRRRDKPVAREHKMKCRIAPTLSLAAALVVSGCSAYAPPQRLLLDEGTPNSEAAVVFNWGHNGSGVIYVGTSRINNHLETASWHGHSHWFVKPGNYDFLLLAHRNDSHSKFFYSIAHLKGNYTLKAGHVYVPLTIDQADGKVSVVLVDKGSAYPMSCAISLAKLARKNERFTVLPECP
jgi:hypothetical protein